MEYFSTVKFWSGIVDFRSFYSCKEKRRERENWVDLKRGQKQKQKNKANKKSQRKKVL